MSLNIALLAHWICIYNSTRRSHPANGLAWMVTSFMRVSVRGRNVFSLTGSFSISSKVSRPSITLLTRLSCQSQIRFSNKNWVCHWDMYNFSCSPLPPNQLLTNKDTTYFPNTVYFMSRWGCLAYVMKNWEPFVLGPLFAIDTTPLTLCWTNERMDLWRSCDYSFETYTKLMPTFKCSLNSSSNLRPHILVPPFPEPEQAIKAQQKYEI